jgi:CRISPR/Cas system-associated exonuclease Cas4 (RecB family)
MTFNFCPPVELPDLDSVTHDDGKRYYVTPSGIRLPSVTTVIGAQSRDSILAWRQRVGEQEANRVSRKASNRGTNVHNLCEKYIKNEPLGTCMPDALEMFQSIKPVLNRIDNVHYIEQAFWSEKVGMAGRSDLIGEFDRELAVIDYKTSSKIKSRDKILHYFWQTAAYALMYEELVGKPINKLVIIMAVENEQPLVFVEKTKDHVRGLVEAIKYYKLNT